MNSKYSKLHQIGSGTFGQVWVVKSQTSERRYVIKEIQLGGMTSYERQQAVSEVTILAECRHQHIIRYKDAFLDEEKVQLSIVMEYADGGEILFIKKSDIYLTIVSKILNWFIQICLGLKYIHTLNILHRDLKTQNLFLTSTGIVKIGDFGIARFLKGNQDLATTAIGTPYYLSPEICQQKPYDHKSDMWSLGCVLYEMSTLSHPFHGRTFQELLMSILCCKYEPISSQYSLLLRDLISVLLRVEPHRRPSASEILAIPAMQCHLYDYFSRHYWNRDNISEGLNMGGAPNPSLGADCEIRRHSTGVTNTRQPKSKISRRTEVRRSASVSVCKGRNLILLSTMKLRMILNYHQYKLIAIREFLPQLILYQERQ
ncbi:serine/threonine-protein kinase Nek5-like [Limulus polyphemus]|uniref:non-specific serine/threonine protein kinase n=1 Tax=Limulus polyphemus TaxID=6850 RepID=A0ABM1TQS2_LIMPO|nr:serine/threonine-protein kinase Nek5-like [Limulus polyphemus]